MLNYNDSCYNGPPLTSLSPLQAFNRLNKRFRGLNRGKMPWYACGHISFRYLDGILLCLDTHKINTVCFTPVSECDILCNGASNKSYFTKYSYSKKLLQIFYIKGATYKSDLVDIPELTIINGHELDIMDEHLYNGCFSTYPCAISNNLMYIQGLVPISSICQYLVSYNQSKYSDLIIKDTILHIVINDRDINNYYIPYHDYTEYNPDNYLTNVDGRLNIDSDYNRLGIGKGTGIPPVQDENGFTSYIDFVNNNGSILVLPMDNNLPELVNLYNIAFSGMPSISTDISISGLVDEWAINDIRAFTSFIKVLKDAYPSINFYTDNEDIDQTNYKEWVNYSMQMRPIRSPLYSTHIFENPYIGRYWYTTLDFTLEYSCNDLPTVLARRDDYCAEMFFNDIKIFKIELDNKLNPNPVYDLVSTGALFWDRDSFDSNVQSVTYQDDTGYSRSVITITGRIIYTNIQYKPRQPVVIDHILTDIISTIDANRAKYTDKSNIIHIESHVENEDTLDSASVSGDSLDSIPELGIDIDYDKIVSEYNKNKLTKGLIL